MPFRDFPINSSKQWFIEQFVRKHSPPHSALKKYTFQGVLASESREQSKSSFLTLTFFFGGGGGIVGGMF